MKKIRDVVHGFVDLDEQEIDIINHPYFQRLRRVKQLSLTDMVYPGANHTRFEHSIGVMQMVSDMYDSIVKKDANLELLRSVYSVNDLGLERYRKIIRLAALLHDIGHPPFSHSGEMLMPLLPKEHSKYISEGNKRYEHEEYSIAAIKTVFRDIIEKHPISNNYQIHAEEVTYLLGDQQAKVFSGLLLLWKQLISGQLDADRADYLLRDSAHLGVAYGIYDKNSLIKYMTLGRFKDTGDIVIAVEDKAWHVAESLVLARYQMFTQVYFHKVRRIYDYHITCATKEILKKLKCKDAYYPTPSKINSYLKFDDWTIYANLQKGFGGAHGEIILNRQHYKCIYETQLIPTKTDNSRIKKLFEEYTKANKDFYIDDITNAYWYKREKDIYISENGYVNMLSNKSQIVKAMISNPEQKRFYHER